MGFTVLFYINSEKRFSLNCCKNLSKDSLKGINKSLFLLVQNSCINITTNKGTNFIFTCTKLSKPIMLTFNIQKFAKFWSNIAYIKWKHTWQSIWLQTLGSNAFLLLTHAHFFIKHLYKNFNTGFQHAKNCTFLTARKISLLIEQLIQWYYCILDKYFGISSFSSRTVLYIMKNNVVFVY